MKLKMTEDWGPLPGEKDTILVDFSPAPEINAKCLPYQDTLKR